MTQPKTPEEKAREKAEAHASAHMFEQGSSPYRRSYSDFLAGHAAALREREGEIKQARADEIAVRKDRDQQLKYLAVADRELAESRASLAACVEALEQCLKHWGDYAPSGGNARKTFDEVRSMLASLPESARLYMVERDALRKLADAAKHVTYVTAHCFPEVEVAATAFKSALAELPALSASKVTRREGES